MSRISIGALWLVIVAIVFVALVIGLISTMIQSKIICSDFEK